MTGKVWLDTNKDGVQDSDEPGVVNVTVELVDENGTTIANTTTDASGTYTFEKVPTGNYTVKVTRPDDTTFSPQDQGSDDDKDSDVTQCL